MPQTRPILTPAQKAWLQQAQAPDFDLPAASDDVIRGCAEQELVRQRQPNQWALTAGAQAIRREWE